jgi:short-subunit dehydrogenase
MPRKIIIIGSTSGIGLQLAKLYLQNGDEVGATGRRNELLQKFQNEFPQQVKTECFDVMEKENLPHLESLVEKLGGMDLLIYNAGFGDVSISLDWEIDRITTLTNVNGFVEIVNWAFNFFVKQGHGHIAATSSIAAIRGNSAAPAYSASKAFMSTYLEGLYIKAGKLKKNIYVTDIQPGFIKTKMAKGKGQFWVASVEKAAKQIYTGIERKRRKLYVTKRWRLIAWALKWMPHAILRKFA